MEERDKKAPAEELIKSLEQTYFDLRKEHPDKDEHWFLANTWLERYGSGEEAKQKGDEWARFTAYRETCDFSILESPKSIRALALSLVHKELGEGQARGYESDFFELFEPIIQSKGKRGFLEEYGRKNPLTWKESQIEDNSSYSLYWFFKAMELEQEREGEAEDEWEEIDIIDRLEEEMEAEEVEKELRGENG